MTTVSLFFFFFYQIGYNITIPRNTTIDFIVLSNEKSCVSPIYDVRVELPKACYLFVFEPGRILWSLRKIIPTKFHLRLRAMNYFNKTFSSAKSKRIQWAFMIFQRDKKLSLTISFKGKFSFKKSFFLITLIMDEGEWAF